MSDERRISLKEFINNYVDFGISLDNQNKPSVFLSTENKFSLDKENVFVSLCELHQMEKQFYLCYISDVAIDKNLALLYADFYFLLFNTVYSLSNIYEANKKFLNFNEGEPFTGQLKINQNNVKNPIIFPDAARISYEIKEDSISVSISISNNKSINLGNIIFIEKKTAKKNYVEIKFQLKTEEIFDLCVEKPIYKEYLGSVLNKTLVKLID